MIPDTHIPPPIEFDGAIFCDLSHAMTIRLLAAARRDLAEAVELLRPFAMIQPRFRVEDHDHWYGYQTTKEAVERAAAFLKRMEKP
jgi:hypothetical protein